MTPHLSEIRQLALTYFEAAGIRAWPNGDDVVTEHGRYGLINLAQHLGRLPRDEWPERVSWHFEQLTSASVDFPGSYAAVKPRLRVRLGGDQDHAMPVSRSITPGLRETLMMKIPIGAVSVTSEAAGSWNVESEVMWNDARDATLWDEPRMRSRLVSPDGYRFTRVGGSFWASSLLLDIGRFLPRAASAGALAVIPCQDLLVFRPVDNARIWADLLAVGVAMFNLGPGSLTPDIFWWRDGHIERVVRWTDRGPLPVWSDEFRQAMASCESAA